MPPAGAQAQPRPDNDIGRAIALHQQGHLDEAAQIYGAILAAAPDQPNALNLLGLLRHQQGRNVEALQLVGAALKRAAPSADFINNYALVLGALGRHEEALAHFERALAINSRHVNALANSANALAHLRRDEEALATYQRLLEVHPDHQGALNESGSLYMRMGRPQAALACYDRALAIAPLAELYVNKGTALRALNREESALASFAAAAAMKPNFAEALWNASLVRLHQGDFASGWKDYEWRWHKADWRGRRRNFREPLWLGQEPIAGKTILLHAEQGLGDTIQFVRYAPLLVERGTRVLLVMQPPLQTLMGSVSGLSGVFIDGESLPAFDVHCPLLSLPLAFGTELATIPANIPYLRPYPERTAKWQPSLPQNGRLRVGICWAGGREHLNDHNRSIRLDSFASLLSVAGLDFVSIQKDVSEGDAAILRQHGVVQLGQQFADFADTAAVVDMLDLVVTVDTSVAHLAGAMGKPVWMLVPFASDWRWLRDRMDSPWYPTMRLFQQTAIGDWSGPLERLRKQLGDAASSPTQALADAVLAVADLPSPTAAAINRGETAAREINAIKSRGVVLKRLRRYDDALAAYQAVLRIDAQDTDALNECGVLYAQLDRPTEALGCYETALAIAPHVVELHVNKGKALVALTRLTEALESFSAAIALDPDNADAHYYSSLTRLQLGDFANGWKEYEWRSRKWGPAGKGVDYGGPLWLGEQPIAGKTLLLLGEQGLGDTIHFLRYAPLVAARGANVILGVHQPLKALAASVPGVALVLGEGDRAPLIDFYCPLMSLPLAFKTELATVPTNIPYLQPQEERLIKWRERLPNNGRLRVGICWAGSNVHLNDRNRSIAIEEFEKILAVSHIDFVSLQKDTSDSQMVVLRKHGAHQLGREFEDFADTAAVVAMLDLVISVDTAVVHLAGAMGKAVAVLLPFSPDWRYPIDRNNMVWYPSMRLYRQDAIRDWRGPIVRLQNELTEVACRRITGSTARG